MGIRGGAKKLGKQSKAALVCAKVLVHSKKGGQWSAPCMGIASSPLGRMMGEKSLSVILADVGMLR